MGTQDRRVLRVTQVAAVAFLMGWLFVPAGRDGTAYYSARVAILVVLLGVVALGLGVWAIKRVQRLRQRPRVDREAWESLQQVREQAGRGGFDLVQIDETQWSTAAGAMVTVVHTVNGYVESAWWPGQSPTYGSLVLAERTRTGTFDGVTSLDAGTIEAARRHSERRGQPLTMTPISRSVADEASDLLRRAAPS